MRSASHVLPKIAVPIRAVLAVSPKAFSTMWWAIQLFHVFCVVNSYAVIEIHRYFIVSGMSVTIDYIGPTTFSFFNPVITANVVLIVCHATAFFASVWWSVKYREWRFTDISSASKQRRLARRAALIRQTFVSGHDKASLKSLTVSLPRDRATSVISRFVFKARLATVVKRQLGLLTKISSALYSEISMFGVEGSYYEGGFFALELVEITFQTYQAYKLSGLVSRVWINRLNAIVLILNCWSTVFVHTVLSRNRLVKRVVLLLVDALFDVITSIMIPFAIIYPYYVEFDFSRRDFPLVNYYDDVWFIQAISENRQIFVTSWLDFVSKISTGFSIFATMLVLKQYLVLDKAKTRDAMRVSQVLAAHTESGTRGRSRSVLLMSMDAIIPRTRTRVVPAHAIRGPSGREVSGVSLRGTGAGVDDGKSITESEQRFMEAALFAKKKLTWEDLLLVLGGLAILVLHVHATVIAVYSSLDGCLLEVRPWFQSAYSCVSLEVNCAHGEYDSGANDDALYQVASRVNIRRVKSVVVSSCANLHVPPLLQTLSALQMIKVYNSTIVRWDKDAELHEDFHPDLQMLYISDSNFSTGELPPGLLGDKFPTRLIDIEFSGTNLARLPSKLHEKWTFMQYFVLERNPQIDEFPEALVPMKIPQLMLGSNSIASIPDDLLADQAFWVLHLNGNPLNALPNRIGTIEKLYRVHVSHTLVSSLPSWMTSRQHDAGTGKDVIPFRGSVDLFAEASPLCLTGETTRTSAIDYFHWNCSTSSLESAYPIEQERRWRAASTAAQEKRRLGD